jgi:hypothetical protein
MFGGEVAGDTLAMDYLSDTIDATLHTVTYAPNIDTNELYADATNELATANGYTSGGAALTAKTVSYNATGNVTTFSSADISWTASGGTLTFQIAVLRDATVATGPLIGYSDVGAQAITTGNTFTIHPTASGLFTATVA